MLWHQLIICAILGLTFSQLDLASSQAAGSLSCAYNFTRVGDKCLHAVNSWFNWYEADRNCRSRNAGLLSLSNAIELQLITKWLNSTLPNTMDLWTSGNSLGRRGTYYWQSNGELARYLPWAAYQPRVADGDCLMLSGTYGTWGVSDYRLAVRNCSEFGISVCEQQQQQQQAGQNTTTRICLKPGTYESAQVVLN